MSESCPIQVLSEQDVRDAGGIVHRDGNVFFTNIDKLNEAILAKLADLLKDAERWQMSHLISKEALTPPEKRKHQHILNAYFSATGKGLDWVASIDAAIDAQKGAKE